MYQFKQQQDLPIVKDKCKWRILLLGIKIGGKRD